MSDYSISEISCADTSINTEGDSVIAYPETERLSAALDTNQSDPDLPDLRSQLVDDQVKVNISIHAAFNYTEPSQQLSGLSPEDVINIALNHGEPFVTDDKSRAPYICGELKVAPWIGKTKERKDGQRLNRPELNIPHEGVQRSKSHCVGSSVIKLDGDGITKSALKKAARRIEDLGLKAAIYTTYSHGVEGKGIRARFILITDRQIAPQDFHAVSTVVGAAILGQSYDDSEHKAYQLAGVWSCHPDRKDKANSIRLDGALVSVDKALALVASCNKEKDKGLVRAVALGMKPVGKVDEVTLRLMRQGSSDPLPVWKADVLETLQKALSSPDIVKLADPNTNRYQGMVLCSLKNSVLRAQEVYPEYASEAENLCRALYVDYYATQNLSPEKQHKYLREKVQEDWDNNNIGGFTANPFFVVSIAQKLGFNCDHITGKRLAPSSGVSSRKEIVELLKTDGAGNDLLHAEIFVRAAHQASLRYTPDGWYRYLDNIWSQCGEAGAIEFSKDILRDFKVWEKSLEDEEEKGAVQKHIAHLSRITGMKQMLAMAQSDPRININRLSEFDKNRLLFQVANGVINLRNGELLPFSPDLLITKRSSVTFDPAATCPKWMKFLCETFGNDIDTIESLHRFVGYCMTGVIREEVVVFATGKGSNGKSTLNHVLTHLLGDYRHQAQSGLIISGKWGDDPKAANPALAATVGARMLAINEAPKHSRIDEQAIRMIGGTELITTRTLHAKPFTFQPTGKLFISLNDLPRTADMGEGLWRRVRVIPFNNIVPESQRNLGLAEELKEEASGILNWGVEGCIKWQEQGLVWSQASIDAAGQYQRNSDSLAEFLDDYIITGSSGDRITRKDLFKVYKCSTLEPGESWMGKQLFYQTLRERKGITEMTSGGTDYFVGIKKR